MQDDDSTPRLSHIDGPSQATMALHPHLPKLAAKMFDVRLANTINAKFLNQADDMVQLRSDVCWEGVEFRKDRRIEDLDAPTQQSIIPVLVCAALRTVGCLFKSTRRHSDLDNLDPTPAGLGAHQASRGADRPAVGPDHRSGGERVRAILSCGPGATGRSDGCSQAVLERSNAKDPGWIRTQASDKDPGGA